MRAACAALAIGLIAPSACGGSLPSDQSCPPTGPTGAAEGDVITDLSFDDCDGVPHSLHGLCERRASWVFVFAGY